MELEPKFHSFFCNIRNNELYFRYLLWLIDQLLLKNKINTIDKTKLGWFIFIYSIQFLEIFEYTSSRYLLISMHYLTRRNKNMSGKAALTICIHVLEIFWCDLKSFRCYTLSLGSFMYTMANFGRCFTPIFVCSNRIKSTKKKIDWKMLLNMEIFYIEFQTNLLRQHIHLRFHGPNRL